MSRAYYSTTIANFLVDDEQTILGHLAQNHEFALEDLQRNAWLSEIRILNQELQFIENGYILLEYSIPRMGKRADAVLLANGAVFVLEFKVGSTSYNPSAIDQVFDYALDLKNFHKQSHDKPIVPILVATKAPAATNTTIEYEDGVIYPLKANETNIASIMNWITPRLSEAELDPLKWASSIYEPTPTIIEAAQALYQEHSVYEISRSDSSAINLSKTSEAIAEIISDSKIANRKSICFVTGVPGAGKTLAGLNIANQRLKIDENEHSLFLSGNGPLVKVLQEALARNAVELSAETGNRMSKKTALSKTRAFIQNIHHFRDDALEVSEPPTEKVVIFDEAQRAWTKEQTAAFMQRRKGVVNFSMSEPEFLISVMDRHDDWATIICLVGGGQEINTGEAGLIAWFQAVSSKYPHWDVYVSSKLSDIEYTQGQNLIDYFNVGQFAINDDLHLAVSVRSFRSEKVSAFVKALLDLDQTKATYLLEQIGSNYPIVLTRDIDRAKQWLQENARGTERYGIIASSRAHRLRPYGISVRNQIDPAVWFLNDKTDIRSSYFMEDVATEFDIQGLEIDWACVAWDADLRYSSTGWQYKDFKGTRWTNVNDQLRRQYLKNTYRVLLSRARQGFVIFIPPGDPGDRTRNPDFYNGTFAYLTSLGIPCL